MNKGIRSSGGFKQKMFNHVDEHGYSVADIAERLDISSKSIYAWICLTSEMNQRNQNKSSFAPAN